MVLILLMAHVQLVALRTISSHWACHRKSSWTIIPNIRCWVFTPHTRQLDELGLERLFLRRTTLCDRFARRTASNSRHMDMFTLGMGVRDIFKSRQLSSQLFFQKSCQGNCQVNCATKNFLQGNCQVNSFSKNFVKAIVKSIVLPKKFFKAIVKSIIWWKII